MMKTHIVGPANRQTPVPLFRDVPPLGTGSNAHRFTEQPWAPSQASGLALHLWHLALSALLAAAPLSLVARTNGTVRGYFIADTDTSGMLVFDERVGTVTVNVNRVGDYNFPSSVHYRLATTDDSGFPGGATAGLDFLPAEGMLNFGPGETNKTFTLTILDDGLIEGDEALFIVLDQPSAGVGIGTAPVPVLIRDNEHNAVRVDPDFKPGWRLSSASSAPPWYHVPLVAVQPTDGKILLVTPADRVTGQDGELVVRLLSDGQPDPAWQAAAIKGAVGLFVVQTNGQVLFAAAGNFWSSDQADPNFSVNGVARCHLARLNADGSVDPGFSMSLPRNSVVTALGIQRNGQILVAAGDPTTCSSGSYSNRLFRTQPSGALDATFQPPALEHFIVGVIAETPEGKILVAPYGIGPLVRLNPDGSRDEQFQPLSDLRFHTIQPDGRLLVTVDIDGSLLALLTANGDVDSTLTRVSYLAEVVPAAKGKIWILDQLPYRWPYLRFLRRNADGSDDPTWSSAVLQGGYSLAFMGEKMFRVLELADGDLLVASIAVSGQLNGQSRAGLARLLVNAPLPRLEVDPSCAIVPENGGRVQIKLLRCGTNTEPVTVAWQTAGGSARPGIDCLPASGTLTFPPNESVVTLELQVLDNAMPDENRTVRLRLEGPPPASQEYPLVEITIANDDLGFPPGGIKRLPNGRVWLRPTGLGDTQALWPSAILETSSNLQDWIQTDLIGLDGTSDMTAPTNSARFYRLRNQ
ncbi:MAG: Calx-beta domain-containing protein [Verrucomicrobiia bacterium]